METFLIKRIAATKRKLKNFPFVKSSGKMRFSDNEISYIIYKDVSFSVLIKIFYSLDY